MMDNSVEVEEQHVKHFTDDTAVNCKIYEIEKGYCVRSYLQWKYLSESNCINTVNVMVSGDQRSNSITAIPSIKRRLFENISIL